MKKVLITLASALALAGTANAADDAAVKTLYESKCMACHASGVAGAPKLGDKDAWAPRIAAGMDALMTSVMNGKNAMPPKGTCMECSKEELRAVVDYMVESVQ